MANTKNKKHQSFFQKANALFDEKNSLRTTIIFTITTLCIYGISYFYQCLIATSWNIPIEFIDGMNFGKNFYFVAFGILYCIGISLLYNYLFYTFIPIATAKRLYKCSKLVNKASRKQLNHFIKNSSKYTIGCMKEKRLYPKNPIKKVQLLYSIRKTVHKDYREALERRQRAKTIYRQSKTSTA